MNNVISMSSNFEKEKNVRALSSHFEREKNVQASLLTAGVTGAMLLLIFLIKFITPAKVEPPVDDVMEINLGSSDVGSGKDQPQLPGDPAPAQQAAYVPPQAAPAHEESVKDVSSDENDHNAPAVIKPTTSRPEATKINTESKTVKTTAPVTQPAPVVAPPKPRATMGHTMGGNGNGGNGADTYKPGTGEGQGGGPGDQGVPGGNPNGKSYTGTPRSFGVKEFSIPNQSFEDDFNQNAKIAMEITTNGDGKVTSASYTSKGSTGTANSQMIEIAKRRAFQLKGIGADMRGTVIFNFKVR